MYSYATRGALIAALLTSTFALTACDAHIGPKAPIAGTVAASRQALPSKPLFDAPIVHAHDVLPHAKAETHEPLPTAVALSSASAPQPASAATGAADVGAVNPAAGMAAAVTDSQGAAHSANGK